MDNDPYSEIAYTKSFLTEVIARVDFLSPVLQIALDLPASIGNRVVMDFPIAEPQAIVSQEIQVSPDDVQIKQETSGAKEWKFFGRDREKFLSIRPDAIIAKYSVYTNYETLKLEFLSAVNELFTIFEGIQGRRLGLRYINNIRPEQDSDIYDWSELLGHHLLCALDVYESNAQLSRAFTTLETNRGEFNVAFRYGMHNPDYPAPMRKKAFVLDIDAYSQVPQDTSDIARNLDMFHREIQQTFEASITDNLRVLMND